MRVSRVGVFETNSSSTHSISISDKADVLDTLDVDEDGVCRIYPGEFGWEEITYTDAATKASYCLTHIKSWAKGNHSLPEMLESVIREATGARSVEFVGNQDEDEDYRWGYIDHQSDHVCSDAFASRESLRAFIFNPESILVTDNDNH